jgi:hypothetical protein
MDPVFGSAQCNTTYLEQLLTEIKISCAAEWKHRRRKHVNEIG